MKDLKDNAKKLNDEEAKSVTGGKKKVVLKDFTSDKPWDHGIDVYCPYHQVWPPMTCKTESYRDYGLKTNCSEWYVDIYTCGICGRKFIKYATDNPDFSKPEPYTVWKEITYEESDD